MNTYKGFCLVVCMSASSMGTSANEGFKMEEVIVTPRKRAESLRDVPLAITAIDGDSVRELGWDTAIDIIKQAPGLSAETFAGKAIPRFLIRGLGTSDFNVAQLTAVGVYLDEVAISSPVAQGIDIYDLERIEILRGPQGTLWGKNNTAGAIHFITAKAKPEFEAFASLGMALVNGDSLQREMEGVINGSLIDEKLAGRVALKSAITDDWVDNRFRGSKVGGSKSFAGRMSLFYTPNEKVRAHLIVSANDQTDDGLTYPGETAAVVATGSGGPLSGNIDEIAISTDNYDEVEHRNITLNIEQDFDSFTLTSITAYNDSEREALYDEDGGPQDEFEDLYISDVSQFSQELRISSPADLSLSWILGAYYFNEDLEGQSSFAGGTDYTNTAELDVFETLTESRERESVALFASAKWNINESWILRAGLRQTRDKENFSGIRQSYRIPISARSNIANPDSAIAGTLLTVGNTPTTDSESWSEPTGDIVLSYSFKNGALAYGRYAHGYRSGTFAPAFFLDVSVADPEFIDSFELGFKSRYAHGRLEANIALYRYQLSDQQVVAFLGFDNNQPITLFGNAADSTVEGAEIELKWRPVDDLLISLGYAYTDSSYDDFPAGPSTNFAGNKFPRTPDWTANAFLHYTMPLQQDGLLEFQLDWRAQPKVFANPANTDTGFGDEHSIANASISYAPFSQNWKLKVWIKNMTNDQFYINRTGNGSIAYAGEPKVMGLTLSSRW